MAIIKPFKCIRPAQDAARDVAALPYDVFDREEACEEVKGKPLSFLNIDRAETQFGYDIDTYDDRVYAKAKELYESEKADGTFIRDEKECYYIYELTMCGVPRTGLVACASIDDYTNNVIKKHENTRADKEVDRIKHVDVLGAQTGPIFLAYRTDDDVRRIIEDNKNKAALYDFVSGDGIRHRVWKADREEDIKLIMETFDNIDNIYIADGHHRAASAVKVGLKKRGEHPDYNGREEFNYFLSVLFPDDELTILPYNRVVKDLNGNTREEFIENIKKNFTITNMTDNEYKPEKKGKFGMYMDGNWYELEAKDSIKTNDPVDGLDVSLLQNYILGPVLGIDDPRTDTRIDFIGGIRGTDELVKRCKKDMAVAFSMYPTSIAELFAVADAGMLMPPKSTWFEPKLRSGLFIHEIE